MSKSEPSKPEPVDFWAIFRDLPGPYLLFEANDPTFTIVEVNKARERMTGISRAACIGRPLFEVHPDIGTVYHKEGVNEVEIHLRELIKKGRAKPLPAFHYDITLPDGTVVTKHWQSKYQPIRNKAGKITHLLATSHDITEEVLQERERVNVEDILAATLTIGKVGSWVWDVEQDRVIGDPHLATLFGVDKRLALKGLPLKMFLDHIHPEDLPRVERAIQTTLRENVPYVEEYRTVTPEGKVRWLLARGRIEIRDERLLFPGVIVDVTERHDLQAQVALARRQDQLNRREAQMLQKRNEELEAIARTKDEFVALASHQLRTPATAVKQYVGMVLQGYAGDISDLQTEMLQRAFESNERQIQIINQILNTARVDTGRLVIHKVSADVCTLTWEVAEDMHTIVEAHRHSFAAQIPDDPLIISADPGYLRMAIENLLHNACIYTPDGGRIGLSVSRQDDQVCIRVSDTGVGIKKTDMERLFTKFSRIHNPLSVQAGGSGIGLYLAAEIVRLHEGEITVESKIGKGTTFAILLPLAHNKGKAKQAAASPN